MVEEELKPLTDVEEEEIIDMIEICETKGESHVSLPLQFVKRLLWHLKAEQLTASNLGIKFQGEIAAIRARNQGAGAFMSQAPVSACPFPEGKQRLAWMYGWEAAQAIKRNEELEVEIKELRRTVAEAARKEGVA